MTRTHGQQRQQSDRMLMTGRAVAAWMKRNEVTPISGANEMVSCARHKPGQERKTPKGESYILSDVIAEVQEVACKQSDRP